MRAAILAPGPGNYKYASAEVRDKLPTLPPSWISGSPRTFPAMRTAALLVAPLLLALGVLSADGPPQPVPSGIDFARQVRPILTDNCFACHGPDEKTRKGGLRLDTRDGLFAPGKTQAIVAPGKPEASELLRRLTVHDAKQMPPKKTGKVLTPAQIDLLTRWVKEGAPWSQHWAFSPPVAAAPPAVKDEKWIRNPIDRFVLARLEKEGLSPSPEADKVRLIRRVTLDLIGLPPTPKEVDDFVNDPSPEAYEKVVERLFNDPRHGERMALEWLDASRFADTHGYHLDSGRDMTRWREYVIEAYNRNKRFDDFTVEQLAGDLLPNATVEQKIASGFNRNHMINFEGGAIPQEYLTAYIVDRVNTTTTVWLGLTVACAQCHDHKYDPISQKEFYQLFAFFHQVPENGLDGSKGNAMPLLRAPTREQEARLAAITAEMDALRKKLNEPAPIDEAAFAAWRKQQREKPAVGWQVLEPATLVAKGGGTFAKEADGVYKISGNNPAQDVYTATLKALPAGTTGLRLEILPDDALNGKGPGRSVNGNVVMSAFRVKAGGKDVALKEAKASFSQDTFPAADAITGKGKGWAIFPEVGKTQTFTVSLDRPLPADAGDVTVSLEFLSQFTAHQPGRIRLAATAAENPFGPAVHPDAVAKLLASADNELTPSQIDELRKYYASTVAPAAKELRAKLTALDKERAATEAAAPTVMVMQDGAKRETHVLVRGQYDKKGDKVEANTPAALPPLPADAPRDRLGLARWLVAKDQPLTARVTVNRYWQMFFGLGLVRTAEDFGLQGEPPTHPELLDWLAAEFARTWDTRHLLRLIVTSATYRQSSRVTPDLLARDPENRLFARASRLRLPAEFIRDQALAVSGLLDGRIGGASVSPYQPPGLWTELTSRGDSKNWTAQEFVQSHGRDLYRRSMYTFWKRTSPPPQMLTFDAPDREVCTVRRSRTNTPLQALVLMNDPTYVEASRKLAERMLTEAKTAEERVAFAFRLATSRQPTDRERAVLLRLYEQQREAYRANPDLAKKLLAVGEAAANDQLDAVELAAWAMVASVVLNLDETITRN